MEEDRTDRFERAGEAGGDAQGRLRLSATDKPEETLDAALLSSLMAIR